MTETTLTPNVALLTDLRGALINLNRRNWKKLGFNMMYWARGPGKPLSPDLGCGTTCCAYGLGSTLPSWIAAGLDLVLDPVHPSTLIRGIHSPIDYELRYCAPPNSRYKLGLTDNQWYYIFGIYGYRSKSYDEITPDDVASHIDYVIDGNSVEDLNRP